MTAPYFVASDADDEPTLWRHDPDRPDYPQPVLRRFEMGDPVAWDGIAAWAAGMSAPTPDLPAVTLTDEERDRLCICDYLVDGKHAGLCDDVRVETQRIVAARLAASGEDDAAAVADFAMQIVAWEQWAGALLGYTPSEAAEVVGQEPGETRDFLAARLAAQPVAPAPDRDALPRVVECPSAGALYDLLASLNDAGLHPAVAVDPAYPVVASLWDVDYAGEVHYTVADPDSGAPHCNLCSECKAGCADCERKPRFPVAVVLAHDPDPAEALDGPVDAWWRAARSAPSGDADLTARVQALHPLEVTKRCGNWIAPPTDPLPGPQDPPIYCGRPDDGHDVGQCVTPDGYRLQDFLRPIEARPALVSYTCETCRTPQDHRSAAPCETLRALLADQPAATPEGGASDG